MKKLYFVILALVVFACCEKKKYYNIPKEDYFFYKEGDTLLYRSNLGNVDTFFISSFYSDYDDVDKTSYYQKILINLSNHYMLGAFNTFYHIYTGMSSFSWLNTRISIYYDSISTIDYEIENHIINRVFRVYDIHQINNPDIISIYYTMRYGVIRYDKKDGEYYELVLK